MSFLHEKLVIGIKLSACIQFILKLSQKASLEHPVTGTPLLKQEYIVLLNLYINNVENEWSKFKLETQIWIHSYLFKLDDI